MGAIPILAGISLGTSLIGGIAEANAQQAAGQAKDQLGQYNRQVLRNAAVTARHNARRAGERGREQVTDIAEKARFLSGRQLTALAANGVVVDSGSGIDLSRDLDRQARRNVARTRQATTDRQAGFVSQAADLEQRGFLAEVTGANAAAAANRQAQSTLVNTGTTVASKWFGFAKEGVFDTGAADQGDILTLASADDDENLGVF